MKRPLRNLLSLLLAMVLLLSLAIPSALAEEEAAVLTSEVFTVVSGQNTSAGQARVYNRNDTVKLYYHRSEESEKNCTPAGSFSWINSDTLPRSSSIRITFNCDTVVNIALQATTLADDTYTLVADESGVFEDGKACYCDGVFTFWANGKANYYELAEGQEFPQIAVGDTVTVSNGSFTTGGTEPVDPPELEEPTIPDGTYTKVAQETQLNGDHQFFLSTNTKKLTVRVGTDDAPIEIQLTAEDEWYQKLSGLQRNDKATFENDAISIIEWVNGDSVTAFRIDDGSYDVKKVSTSEEMPDISQGQCVVKRSGNRYVVAVFPVTDTTRYEVTLSAGFIGEQLYNNATSFNSFTPLTIINNAVNTHSTESVQLYGASMELDGTIKVNFMVNRPLIQTEAVTAVATMNGVELGRIDLACGENTLTVSVPAKNMNDPITVTVWQGDVVIGFINSSDETLQALSKSVADLAQATREHTEDTDLTTLMDKMTAYGTAAADYFNDASQVQAPDSAKVEAVMDEVKEKARTNDENNTPGYTVSPSLVLKDQTEIKYYIKLSDEVLAENPNLAVTINDNSAVLEATTYKGYQYYCKSNPIPANMLGDMLTLTVKNGNEPVYTMEYCPMSYVHSMLSKDTASDSLKALLVSMYEYYAAAWEYENTLTQNS